MSAGKLKSLALAVVMVGSSAFARGVLLSPEQLPRQSVEQLREQLGAARGETPVAFASVRELREQANELDAKKRGGKVAPMGRAFKALGPAALLPMLELMVLDTLGTAELTEGGKLSLQVGLVEAVGALRDPRAAPVLLAVLDQSGQKVEVTRAAAEAYGFLQSDEVAENLVKRARAKGELGQAVRAGMGSCRRSVVAAELGAQLAKASQAREVIELTRALGDVGSAWAWKTPGVTAKGEEQQVRDLAAKALVASFVARDGEARQAASNALMMVDAAATPALIAEAKGGANAQTVAALDGLAQRFANNPAR